MPLTNEQKQGLRDAGVRAKLEQIKPYIDKFMALRPENGALDSNNYLLALGALWYLFQGALRSTHGERVALQEDIEANLLAALIAPEAVGLSEAVGRAQDYYQMADPATKA